MKTHMQLTALCLATLIFAALAGAEAVRQEWWFVVVCVAAASLFLAFALEAVERDVFAAFDEAMFREFTGGRHG